MTPAKKAWGEFESHVLNIPGSALRNRAKYPVQTLRLRDAQPEVHLQRLRSLGHCRTRIDPRPNLGVVEQLHGQTHIRNPLQRKVEEHLNQTPLAQMVQHSGEMQFAAPTDQPIDAFGPSGEVVTLLNLQTWKAWCRDRFGGRISIGEKY